MKLIYSEIKEPKPKNTLKIIMSECTTDHNDKDLWGASFTFIPEDVKTKEDVENYLKGFFFIKDTINKSREGYGENYNSVEFEDETEVVKDIELNCSEEIIGFTCGGSRFEYPFGLDGSMPTGDGHYFAGIKFVSAFYYDQNGNKFEVKVEE